MKRAKLTLFLLPLLTFFALGVTTVQADTTSNDSSNKTTLKTSTAAIVRYDKASDQLSVTADSASLKSVLGAIARQSGIEVLFDDLAEELVSIDIQSETLESGLKHMLKGRNHMMRYSRDDQQKLLLIGVMVLPVGEQDSGRARRLVAMDHEAMYRARSELSLEQAQQIDVASERWQARLSELPPENREKLDKIVAADLLRQAQREQRHADRKKEHEQRVAKREKKFQEAQERVLKKYSQEQRSAYEQSRKEANEQMKAILLKEQNQAVKY